LLSNFTTVGPNNATGVSADYGYGMRWRRGAKFILANAIVMGGQKAGLDLDNDPTAQYYIAGTSGLKNSLLQAVTSPYKVDKLATAGLLDAAGLKALVEGRDGTKSFTAAADIMLTDPFNNAAPNLLPKAGSPAIVAGKFDGSLSDSFFDKTNYIGAIDPANDWSKASWIVYGK
jgi:hypothetical protein